MDPVSHTLVGAALAQTGLERRSAYGAAALIIGANLPDLDAITMFISADTSLYWRRGWTHGLPAVVVLPLLLTALLCLWDRWVGRRSGPTSLRPKTLLGLSYLAVATHPALDWLNNYGMRWLMPFDGRWYYGDAVFIVDPWFWLILGGALFLGRSHRIWSLLGWALFAGLAIWLLQIGVPELPLARALWGGVVVVLVLLRLGGVGRHQASASRIAIFAPTSAAPSSERCSPAACGWSSSWSGRCRSRRWCATSWSRPRTAIATARRDSGRASSSSSSRARCRAFWSPRRSKRRCARPRCAASRAGPASRSPRSKSALRPTRSI
jgi:membrane-bound metal-dependent hydrolase YbcI (DUF457 family)